MVFNAPGDFDFEEAYVKRHVRYSRVVIANHETVCMACHLVSRNSRFDWLSQLVMSYEPVRQSPVCNRKVWLWTSRVVFFRIHAALL